MDSLCLRAFVVGFDKQSRVKSRELSSELERRLDVIDRRLEIIDRRLDGHDQRLDGLTDLAQRIHVEHSQRLTDLERHFTNDSVS